MTKSPGRVVKTISTLLILGALTAGSLTGTARAYAASPDPQSSTNSTLSSAEAACLDTAPRSGPAAAAIADEIAGWVHLREGNSSFGRVHIANGGANHELTEYAKNLWRKAIASNNQQEQDTCFFLSYYRYTTSGGSNRTMCVVHDHNDYTYAGTNYGVKGIITAYWVSGHTGFSGCRQ